MKIGLTIPPGPTLLATLEAFEDAERAGFQSAWFSQPPTGFDALTVLALAGARTREMRLGSAVLATFPRHPLVTARAAETVAAAAPGRLTLGVGSGHRAWVEDVYGLPFVRPVPRTVEWIETARGFLDDGGAASIPIVLAATGPRMLAAGGEVADGVLTWMGDEAYLEEVVMPRIATGAGRRGREAPPVLAGALVCLTANPAAAREGLASRLAPLAGYESYEAPLRHGSDAVRAPIDVAILGDEREIGRRLTRFAAVGVDETIAVLLPDPADPAGSLARGRELLGEMSRAAG